MPPTATAAREPRDGGFTMIEVLTVILLLGIVLAIGIGGWSRWSAASAHRGAAETLQGVMRDAQQRAVTEGTSVCVMFSTGTDRYATYRGRCGDASLVTLVPPTRLDSKRVHLSSPAFTGPTGTLTGVTFLARGTATPGSVKLVREGSTTVQTVRVEGLTGRVDVA